MERRGEDVGRGLERLSRVAAAAPRSAEALLDAVLAGLPAGGTDDLTVLALGCSG